MNKIIFVLLFIVSLSSLAEESEKVSRIQGSKELPLELNQLILTLQDSDKYQEEFIDNIKKIDSYARTLSKEDLFLIGKIEIYKTLLKSNDLNLKASIDGDSIKVLKDSIKKTKDPFIKWFLQALLHDSESILSNPIFREYILQKNNGPLEKIEYKKLDKKIQLICRWISKLNPANADFEYAFKVELSPILIEALKNISQSYFLVAQNSQSKIVLVTTLKDLKFFSLASPKSNAEKKAKKEKSVDEILAPLTQESPSEQTPLPGPSKENWLEDENIPTGLKNLPKPSDDADWLQDI